jgi:hypothetical protein
MTRQLAERVFFFLQRMPIVLAWQVDQSYAQMLSAPEVQNTISSVATAAGSTTRFVDATDRFAGSVERFRADIPRLRQEAVEQVEQAVARQRDVAIQQTTTRISAERVAAVEQLGSTVRTEQGEFSKSAQQALNATIDHLYWRAIGLVCVIVIAALVYRIAARKLTPIATMKNDSPQPAASPK